MPRLEDLMPNSQWLRRNSSGVVDAQTDAELAAIVAAAPAAQAILDARYGPATRADIIAGTTNLLAITPLRKAEFEPRGFATGGGTGVSIEVIASQWGVDSSGNAYFDDAGVIGAEAAYLTFDSDGPVLVAIGETP